MGWTGILTMRVCCLWEQRRRLVWAIQTAWVVMMCAYIVTEYFAYKEGGGKLILSKSWLIDKTHC
jgi:hypothetical protein